MLVHNHNGSMINIITPGSLGEKAGWGNSLKKCRIGQFSGSTTWFRQGYSKAYVNLYICYMLVCPKVQGFRALLKCFYTTRIRDYPGSPALQRSEGLYDGQMEKCQPRVRSKIPMTIS